MPKIFFAEKILQSTFYIHTGTKDKWRQDSKLEWVESILQKLRVYLESAGYPTVAAPLLSAGKGGLNPGTVRELILSYFAEYPNKIWVDGKWYSNTVVSVNTANTDDTIMSSTGTPEASKGTSTAEARNLKVSKEETRMENIKENIMKAVDILCAQHPKKETPAHTETDTSNTWLISAGYSSYITKVAGGMGFQLCEGKKPEELARVGATKGVNISKDGNALVVGLAELSNGPVKYRGNVELGSDVEESQTVIRLDNNVISRVTTGGAEMDGKIIKLKESSKEDILRFESSSGYTVQARTLDVVNSETVMSILQEAFDSMPDGATFGFCAVAPETTPPAPAPKPAAMAVTEKINNETTVEEKPFDLFNGSNYLIANMAIPTDGDNDDGNGNTADEDVSVAEEEIDDLESLHIIRDVNGYKDSLIEDCQLRWRQTLKFFVNYFRQLGITPEEAAKALGTRNRLQVVDGEVTVFDTRRPIQTVKMIPHFSRNDSGAVICSSTTGKE